MPKLVPCDKCVGTGRKKARVGNVITDMIVTCRKCEGRGKIFVAD